MYVKKHLVGSDPVQGYPADGKVLNTDLVTLQQLYKDWGTTRADSDNDVTQLVLGLACDNIKVEVEERLKGVREKLFKLCPDSVNDGQVKLHMGPLKKVQRITQKAVHAAVEADLDTIQLAQVNDILRATIELPTAAFQKEGFGSQMIDTLNGSFHGELKRVKNRFVEVHYPRLTEYYGRKLTPSLVKDIEALVHDGIRGKWKPGRDTFYRDLQLLIRLDRKNFDTGTALTHVFLEVQLVSDALYGAKVMASDSDMSGHQMYRICREVMEYCEFDHWTAGGKKTPRLPDAESYYSFPPAGHWENFTRALGNMWDLYRKSAKQYVPTMETAIDNSEWYKNSAKAE